MHIYSFRHDNDYYHYNDDNNNHNNNDDDDSTINYNIDIGSNYLVYSDTRNFIVDNSIKKRFSRSEQT